MKFIVGVILLIIQLISIRALDLDHESGHSQIDFDVLPSKLLAMKNVKQLDVKSRRDDTTRVNRIIFDIKSQDFKKALKKMQRLKVDLQGAMNYVIHEVYNNNAGNLELILQFVASNENVTSNLAIYQALNYEMNINDHNSYLLRLKLMKSFNNKTIDQSSIPASDQEKAKMLKNELVSLASSSTTEELKVAMKSNDSAIVSKISENVYNNYPILFEDVIRQVLNEAYDVINDNDVLEFFTRHKHASQSIYAYAGLFGALRKRNLLNRPFVVTLAFALRKAMDAGISDRHAYGAGNFLKIALPESVRNIAFGNELCILNVYYNNRGRKEPLFAAGETYDDKRRKVYSWVPGDSVVEGLWYIEQHGSKYYIKNSNYIRRENRYRTEYLFAATFWNFDFADERHVFTWIPGPPDDEQFEWEFVPKGNNVFIRNGRFKEYLYAGKNEKGEVDFKRREIFTKSKIVKNGVLEPGTLWYITDECKRKH